MTVPDAEYAAAVAHIDELNERIDVLTAENKRLKPIEEAARAIQEAEMHRDIVTNDVGYGIWNDLVTYRHIKLFELLGPQEETQ